jgi:Icc-related predicted phosphoesterase
VDLGAPRPTRAVSAGLGRSSGLGDEVLSGWIARFRPDLVLVGHVHQAPFARGGSWVDRVGSTWVFNAGQQLGPVPAHVTADLDANTATWTSTTERAAVVLG